jgi:hypothetical protein
VWTPHLNLSPSPFLDVERQKNANVHEKFEEYQTL